MKLDKGVETPAYQTAGAAAVDLCANIKAPFIIAPGEVVKIPTGIYLDMAETNLCALILPRSGLGSKGLVLANTVGLIDNDYQGEIVIMAFNRNSDVKVGMGSKPARGIEITPKMRIAQMMFTPMHRAEFQVVDDFAKKTERGKGGFGSTGA